MTTVLSLGQLSVVKQALPRRQAGPRHRCGVDVVHGSAASGPRSGLRPRERIRRPPRHGSVVRQSEHLVANGESGRPESQRGDHPRHLLAGDDRGPLMTGPAGPGWASPGSLCVMLRNAATLTSTSQNIGLGSGASSKASPLMRRLVRGCGWPSSSVSFGVEMMCCLTPPPTTQPARTSGGAVTPGARCLVGGARADATKGQRRHDHPIRARARPAGRAVAEVRRLGRGRGGRGPACRAGGRGPGAGGT